VRKNILFIILVLSIGLLVFSLKNDFILQNIATVLWSKPIAVLGPDIPFTIDNVIVNFGNLNILIVPGHEPNKGGGEYKTIKERDLNVQIAQEIANELQTDSNFKVIVSRDYYSWNSILKSYFDKQSTEIKNFIKDHSETMKSAVKEGTVSLINNVYHNKADEETVLHLYGLNKIISEQKVDLVIHVHVNDYPGRKYNKVGKATGFSIYVPESQYKNSISSKLLAEAVFPFLNNEIATSTLPQEQKGIVEDQDLIAIGSKNTLTKPCILIEYGYIYESIYSTTKNRKSGFQNFGRATADGIKNFINKNLKIILADRENTIN